MTRKRGNQRGTSQSLTNLLAKAFLAVSAIILLIASSEIIVRIRDSREAVAEKQRLIAEQAANTVATFVRERLADLEAAVKIGDPATASRQQQRDVLDRLLGLQPAFRHLALLDSDGRELANVARLSHVSSGSLTDRIGDELFTCVEQGLRYVGAVYIDETTCEPQVIMAIPMTDVFGTCHGTLLAEVNLKFMWDVVDRLEIGETGSAYVVDRQGHLIAFGDITRVLRGERMGHLTEVREFMDSPAPVDETGAGISTGIGGALVVGTYVPLGTPDWAVVTELPVSEAYREVGRGVLISLAVLLFAAVLAKVIGLAVARRLTRPLLNLTDTATRIAEGETDLQAASEGPTEVVSLAAAFNNMTGQLRDMLRVEEQRRCELQEEIAERRKAQGALRESEQRFRVLVEQAADAFFLSSPDGRVRDVNQRACDSLGYTREELLSMALHDIDVEVAREQREGRLWEKLVPGEAVTIEGVQQRKDGSAFPVEVRVGLLDLGGECFMLGLARDITERKEAERERQAAQAELARHRDHLEELVTERTSELAEANHKLVELKKAIEQSIDGVAVLDIEGRVEFVNAAWADMHGYRAEQLRGQPLSVFHSDRQMDNDVLPFTRKVVEVGGCNGEVGHVRKDGTPFPTWMSVALLKDDQGEPTGFIAVARDITEQKEAERALAEANKQLVEASRQAGMADVATSVLHNVGNVLNSVNVSANLVAERVRTSKVGELKKAADLVARHADDMGAFVTEHPQGKHLARYLIELGQHTATEQEGMIEALQDLQKDVEHIKQIVAMQQTYAKISGVVELVSPREIVEDALRMRADSLERHNIEIAREYADVPALPLDRHNVMQILVNLVGNAKHAIADHRAEGGRLTVRIDEIASGIRFEVIDNGVGIVPENLTRIFQHGFTTKKDGHGFGLHGSANAASGMGGSLTVHSDGAGQGARFTLEIPVAREPGRGAVGVGNAVTEVSSKDASKG